MSKKTEEILVWVSFGAVCLFIFGVLALAMMFGGDITSPVSIFP
jgi:hypothetical protein